MAKEENDDVFGGFDAVYNELVGSASKETKYPYREPEEIEEEEEVTEEVEETDEEEVEVEESDDDATDSDDESEEPVDEVDEEEPSDKPAEGDEGDDDEESIVSPFVDLFSKELGWELEDDEKPKSITELVEYMSELVEANSKPKYASEEIQKLDDYVKAGGDVDSYFNSVYGEVDLTKVDLTKEENQKKVVRELLKLKGFSEARIDKKISTYEDAGVLQEEAEDASEILSEEREKTKEKLLEDNKKLAEEHTKKQQKFISDVKELIDGVSDIRGMSIPKKERDALKDYIFKVDREGKTGYQRDYAKNYKNLIESAYFTMKGDSLLQGVKSRAQSDAVKELKMKLKNNQRTNRSSSSRNISTEKPDIISAISRALIKPR
jgi:hypothetical protein